MRALSVKQPWAYLLVVGAKTVEVRSWSTDYRGDLLICASAAPKNFFIRDSAGVNYLLPAGCILGVVRVIEVRPMKKGDAKRAFSPYDPAALAWVVEPVSLCRPDKIIGRLHLFDVPDSRVVKLDEGTGLFDFPPPQGKVEFTPACPVL